MKGKDTGSGIGPKDSHGLFPWSFLSYSIVIISLFIFTHYILLNKRIDVMDNSKLYYRWKLLVKRILSHPTISQRTRWKI